MPQRFLPSGVQVCHLQISGCAHGIVGAFDSVLMQVILLGVAGNPVCLQ